MARRRLTVKHLDPWSVLKFSVLANIAFTAIAIVGIMVVWTIVDRLGIVEQICGIAIDIGFTQCGLSTNNMLRAGLTIGALWVVVQTAVMVFMAFLYNLIADLTGGVTIIAVDDAAGDLRGSGSATRTTAVTGEGEAVTRSKSRPAAANRTDQSTAAMPAVEGGGRSWRPARTGERTARQAPVDPVTRPSERSADLDDDWDRGATQAARSVDDDDELFGSR